MTNKEKKAITKLVMVAENPTAYGIAVGNTEEQNKAIIKVLRTLFDFDDKMCTGFNAQTIENLNKVEVIPDVFGILG